MERKKNPKADLDSYANIDNDNEIIKPIKTNIPFLDSKSAFGFFFSSIIL